MKIAETAKKNELDWEISGQVGAKIALESFLQSKSHDSLPHAFLFLGPKGVGKYKLAKEFAGKIFKDPDSKSEVFEYDFVTSPSLEELRDIIGFSSLTSSQSKKVFILNNFELASMGSVNSLLKTLEEPPASSMFIIVSNGNTVLPTIKSRCISIRCYPSTQDAVNSDLPKVVAEAVIGYPELAARLLESPELVSLLEDQLPRLKSPNLNQIIALSKLEPEQLQLLLQLWTMLLKQEIQQGSEPKPLIKKIRTAMQTHADLSKSFNTKLVLQQFLIETKI